MEKQKILKKYFGYDCFREGQEFLIDQILAGRDVLGIMPTGAGKSICYQVPALLMPGITLVISPLISLMKDQVQALNQAGIHAAYINSSLTENQITKALQLAAAGRYKIIYVAPERLETYEFLAFAASVQISMLTVDEAHCISQWGQDFRPSYLKIVRFLNGLEYRPVVSAFTATATENVKEDIACVLGLQQPQILVTGFDRKNLYFGVEKPRKKENYVLNYVKQHLQDSGIVYCATRKNVDMLYEKLKEQGVAATRYHAGLGNEERKQNQDDFIYDRTPVIVATNAFGMGIDKSNVRYVLHYNMPQSLENYYQEAGRAGRDGEESECILLYSAQDLMINRFLLESKAQNTDLSYEEMQAVRERDEERLRIMSSYCMSQNCLRGYILRYFGEQAPNTCDKCSNCLREYEEEDQSETAGTIIEGVRQLQQRYGINVVAGTLAGSDRAKLRDYGMENYDCYGSLSQMPEAQIKQLINQMVFENMLSVTEDKYALIRLGEYAKEVLEGKRQLKIKHFKSDSSMEVEIAGADGSKKTSSHNRKSDILNSKGLEVFEQLRMLRTEIAREESVPPYIIFSDKTLVDLCVRVPTNKAEMLRVSGVGEAKFEKYGEIFLERLAQIVGDNKEKLYFGESQEARESSEEMCQSVVASKRKQEFSLNEQQAEHFLYTDQYFVTQIAEQLSSLRDASVMKKLPGTEIFRRIEEEGYAGKRKVDGRWTSVISEKGKDAGLFLGMRVSQKGTEYEDIYYDRKAQKMIVGWFVK